MEERKAKKKASDPKTYEAPNDLLQDLMDATYKDGSKPTPTEITGILIGVLLGGQHTSNVTGTWALTHLLKNKEWYDKIMQEQERILGSNKSASLVHPTTLTYKQVQDMPLFDQVLSETLRMHHPFFQLSRAVKQDVVYTEHEKRTKIPAGHFVNIAPSAAMSRPDLFENGHVFDPSRFEPEKKAKLKPHSFVPFGGGMHQCGGRKFAWNSLKVSLSWLLRNYDMEFIGKGSTEMPKEDFTTMVVAPTTAHVQIKYKRKKHT